MAPSYIKSRSCEYVKIVIWAFSDVPAKERARVAPSEISSLGWSQSTFLSSRIVCLGVTYALLKIHGKQSSRIYLVETDVCG